jgi:hypothetical protein
MQSGWLVEVRLQLGVDITLKLLLPLHLVNIFLVTIPRRRIGEYLHLEY